MPKVLIGNEYVDVAPDALFADDGQTPLNIPTGPVFTADDIEKARQQEKDKLYAQIQRTNEDLTKLREQIGTLTTAEEQRKQQLEAEQARLADEQRRLEEEELSAKDLIRRSREEWDQQRQTLEAEWNNKLEEERQARLAAEAARQKEKEFNDLREYAQAQVAAHQNDIAPQLLSWVEGNTREEIDRNVARAIETTNGILSDLQQAQQLNPDPNANLVPATAPQVPQQQFSPQPPALPGTRVTAAPGADPNQQFQQVSADQINKMSMAEYAEFRRKVGVGGQSNSQGLFG